MNPSGGSGSGGGSNWTKVTTPTNPGQTGTGPKIGAKPTPPPKPPRSKWTPIVKPTTGTQAGTGPTIGTGKTLNALNKATDPTQTAPSGVQNCPLKKHFVKVKLHFKDDDKPVPTTGAEILQGFATVNGGPLAAGELEARDLDPGDYTVHFPDIDASEWEPA